MSKETSKLIFNLKLNSIVEEEVQQEVTKPEYKEERLLELKRFYKQKRRKDKAMIKEYNLQKRLSEKNIGSWQRKYGPTS